MGNNSVIPLQVGDVTLPLRESVSSHGNAIWALQGKKANGERYVPRYGLNLEGIFTELPTGSIEILGTTVELVADVTEAKSYTDDDGNTRKSKGGKARVRGTAKVTVPNHGSKTFTFRATTVDAEAGIFNVEASVDGHGNSNGAPNRHHLDDL